MLAGREGGGNLFSHRGPTVASRNAIVFPAEHPNKQPRRNGNKNHLTPFLGSVFFLALLGPDSFAYRVSARKRLCGVHCEGDEIVGTGDSERCPQTNTNGKVEI